LTAPGRSLAVVSLLLLAAVAAFAGDGFLSPAPVRLDREGERWAERTLQRMSLEEKIGQMLMIWARAEFLNVDDPEYRFLRENLERYHIGAVGLTVRADGAMVFRNQPYEAVMLTNRLQRGSKLPLIIAADFERGVSMRLGGVTVLPHAMAFAAAGSAEWVEAFGRISAQEARAVGVHWNFFPVADVNSNPANPIINTRSFGEDPAQVSELTAAYIRGAKRYGLLTTAKHFPGHGDTDTDSHVALARVSGDRARLDAVELPPFRAAIAAGVDAVMVAHVTVPAIDASPTVASISEPVITGLLRRELGFDGLVVTDAMDMAALTQLFPQARREAAGRAAVAAVQAGNDMVLIPTDLDGAYHGLLDAVRSGAIPQARIDQSVRRILRAKASVGLHKARLVDVDTLERIIAHPQSAALAQQVADAAVTLVRENGQVLPLRPSPPAPDLRRVQPSGRIVAVLFTDHLRAESGRAFERALRQRVPDATIFYVDPRLAEPLTPQIMAAIERAEAVLAVMYIIPSAGRAVLVDGELVNTLSLPDSQAALLRAMLARAGASTAVIAMGSPYVGAEFPQLQNYLCTFSNVSVSEVSAVKALFGEIPIRGRLPVSVPNLAERGGGIQRGQLAQGAQ
jgi:beta-N-acetylhexosaminidase